MMAGYSATPLAKKLGIKESFRIMLINQPEYYFRLFTDLPKVEIKNSLKSNVNFVHLFTNSKSELNQKLSELKKQITPDGIIWVSWYKKASKLPTELTEDIIRNTAIDKGLVDIKVCAVDEIWSGLKLVIPVKDRR